MDGQWYFCEYKDGNRWVDVLFSEGEVWAVELGKESFHYRRPGGDIVIVRPDEIEYLPSYSENKVASIIFRRDGISFKFRNQKDAPRPDIPDVEMYELTYSQYSERCKYDINSFPNLIIPQFEKHERYQGLSSIETEDGGELVDYESLIRLL